MCLQLFNEQSKHASNDKSVIVNKINCFNRYIRKHYVNNEIIYVME